MNKNIKENKPYKHEPKKREGSYRIVPIRMPQGTSLRLCVDESTDTSLLFDSFVMSRWSRYFENNWLNYNNRTFFSPEEKVKNTLCDSGELFLGGKRMTVGILSKQKDAQINSVEIPFSSCSLDEDGNLSYEPPLWEDAYTEKERERILLERMKEADTEEKRWKKRNDESPTKFTLLNRLFDKGTVQSAVVDTENMFEHCGKKYVISDKVEGYLPKDTKVGDIYDWDKVYILTDKRTKLIEFYAQDVSPLEGLVIEVH